MKIIGSYVDGNIQIPNTEKYIDVKDPSTGEIISKVALPNNFFFEG